MMPDTTACTEEALVTRHREYLRHGTTSAGDRWTMAGICIVGAAGAAMSWTGWFLLAAMCGWSSRLAWLLPIAVDVYVVTSMRVWLRVAWVSPKTRRFAAFSTMFAVVLSVAANAAYHLMDSLGWRRAPWPVVVAVSGLAPLMLALVAHLQARLNADRAMPAESHVESHEVAPVVAPAAAVAEATAEPVPATADAAGDATAQRQRQPAAVPVSAASETTADATETATEQRQAARQPTRQKPRQATRQNTGQTAAAKRAKAGRLVAADPAIAATVLAAKCGVSGRTAQRWKTELTRPHLVGNEVSL